MTTSVSRRRLLAGCTAVGAVGLAGCLSQSLSAEEIVEQAFDATGVTEVSVETINGAIDVHGGDTETIEVEATKQASSESRLDDVALDITHEEDTLTIDVDTDDGGLLSWLREASRVDLTLVVPESLAALNLRTTNGNITMEGVGGEVTAETTNGTVEVSSGAVETMVAETTNGNVTLELLTKADITVGTVNGNVELTLPSDAEPELSYETINGRLTVTGFDAGPVESNGSLETTFGSGTHSIVVDTTNGDLDMYRQS